MRPHNSKTDSSQIEEVQVLKLVKLNLFVVVDIYIYFLNYAC